MANVATTNTVEDTAEDGKVMKPLMVVRTEKVVAPRRRILNRDILTVVQTSMIKLVDPSVDHTVRQAKR